MVTDITKIEIKLRQQLKEKGLEDIYSTRFIKDMMISFSDDPSISQFKISDHLHLLGWDNIVLDYHTFQLAKAHFENDVEIESPVNNKGII